MRTEVIRPEVDKTPFNALARTLKDLGLPYRVKLDPASIPWVVPPSGPREPTRIFKQTKADLRWLETFPCRRGSKIGAIRANIYIHSSTRLGFIGKGLGLRQELLAVPGVVSHQTGDKEFSVTFPDSALPLVAGIVRPFLKRGSLKNTPVLEK